MVLNAFHYRFINLRYILFIYLLNVGLQSLKPVTVINDAVSDDIMLCISAPSFCDGIFVIIKYIYSWIMLVVVS